MQLFFVYNNTKLYCFFLCLQAMRPICRINHFLLMENATPSPLLFRFPLTRRLYIKYNKPNITRRTVR